MRFSVDTGGTFTDLVVEDDSGGLRLFKSPTTPEDPVAGVLNVIRVAAEEFETDVNELLGSVDLVLHATTRAINAILTGATARTALLATQGHRDILVFREGGRSEPFNFTRPYPEPYVPRSLTFEVPERVGAAGEIVVPLDEAEVVETAGRLRELDVEAVAVCLLWSIVNPAHELRVGEILADLLPEIPYTLSHLVNPGIREYRRASSAALDASLKPVMTDYLRTLHDRLAADGFRGRLLMVTSNGGVLGLPDVAAAPIHAIGSGPSMAPVAGTRYAHLDAGAETAIVADTGGTSYDVSLVRNGRIPRTRDTWLGERYMGHLTGFPSVDVRSIGAGGGSIAWVDEGGLLHVGPHSAGSVPGPVCYDRGGVEPTVTDASLVLGHVDPSNFLGGSMQLSVAKAKRAISERVASLLGMDTEAAAAAVLEVATDHMVSAIEEITTNQGIDPRAAVLVGGGGAAGLNAVAIARRLGCGRVIIPEVGATLSAAGALLSDLMADFEQHFVVTSDAFDGDGVNDVLAKLGERARQFLESAGVDPSSASVDFAVEARYLDQVWELEVPLAGDRFDTGEDLEDVCNDFHALHHQVFAVSDPSSPIEMISWRATARSRLPRLGGTTERVRRRGAERQPAGSSARRVCFPGHGVFESPVRQVDSLASGEVVQGPAILESSFTTVVVEPGARAEKGASGSLLIAPGRSAASSARRTASASDGVQLALITNRFERIVRKMTNTLFRTARSGVINSARDFSCCILTADCELLAAAESLPIHIMSGPDLMAKVMKDLYPELKSGDAFLNNSPYHGNSHAGDHAMLVPVVDSEGVHRYTVCVKAHVADCGNSQPSSYMPTAHDVYEEGALIFPCVKTQEDYADKPDIVRMCEMRIRAPEQWRGDYRGFVGALRIGEREVLRLGNELGWDVLATHQRDWFAYSERRMVDAIKRLPHGTVAAENAHDPFPGAPDGVPITVKVSVDTQEAMITVDLRGNPDCFPNGLNLTEATARTAGMIGIFNSIDHTVPPNAGSYRRLRVLLRENCVAGIPRHPASCSLATTGVADRVANAVQRAMAQLGTGVGMAEVGLCIPASSAVISGKDPRRGNAPFVNMLILGQTGGAGAPEQDGWLNVAHVGNAGLMLRDSTEVDEIRHPVRIWVDELVPDSEGAGMFRGAPAARVEYGPVATTIEAVWSSDGSRNPALGVRGGLSGACAGQFRRIPSGDLVELEPWGHVTVAADERIVSTSCGGGGYGSPLRRDPERVRRDVLEGWVSRRRATDVYGVVLDAAGEIDGAATERNREQLAQKHREDDWTEHAEEQIGSDR